MQFSIFSDELAISCDVQQTGTSPLLKSFFSVASENRALLEVMQKDVEDLKWTEEKLSQEVKRIVGLFVEDNMTATEQQIRKAGSNLMPVTFTTWRLVALKHIKKLHADSEENVSS